jgi:isoleucyl-tRNA synthetase
MCAKYSVPDKLDLVAIHQDILTAWEAENTFEQSVSSKSSDKPFTFFEGPPSANGIPGIHHVMARTIKDAICRFKTMQGYQVSRKAGWDTHGLPVELQVEKELGITKEDIGHKISMEEYNEACRKSVMRFTHEWNKLTAQMGYWVDMEKPYVTYQTPYMESVWWLLQQFYKKGLLYKGYSIQPFSPAAGTGLSTHELNQPGTYKEVKDTSVVAQFRLLENQQLGSGTTDAQTFALAWTTTPWTLPSNTALAVGPDITYVKVATLNPYTKLPVSVILAEALLSKYFDPTMENAPMEEDAQGAKKIPFKILERMQGSALVGLRYEQLLPYAQPTEGDAFRVIAGDFVSTEDGTGMVHIAPSFGADDFRVAQKNGIGALTLVDRQGKFTAEVTDFAGEFVKEAYLSPEEKTEGYESVDVRIAMLLKQRNRAFRIEKYAHNYPHCWRTDKPILYYPLDSWFIRTTALRERLIALNQTIRWKPESTGTGRFGNWLENLVDWNLSRSRFWGVPLPIWRTQDGKEEQCIGSVQELFDAVEAAVKAGLMEKNPLPVKSDGTPDIQQIDLHRPQVDPLVLVSPAGQPMYRESDLIDVWFDSGAMPYAQWHYPFENKEKIEQGQAFPADFIAEGVDQTRGWFFTLHVIAAGVFDQVAYKSVISNGLVLDKFGQKMSKRLGNAVDPFQTMEAHGADALRWYMMTNAAPWDNLKFDVEGIQEVKRKFFGTLYNTYAFFALYANVDGATPETYEMAEADRPEFDQWIRSRLATLSEEVEEAYEAYELTKAGRLIQDFVTEELSNWYVRLSRRRFWKGDMHNDKKSAYATLYLCLDTVSRLMAPLAPFFADWLFRKLHPKQQASVHLADWPSLATIQRNPSLEKAMDLAREVTSLALSIRKKEKIRVRQPLKTLLIPSFQPETKELLAQVRELLASEINVKEVTLTDGNDGFLVKKVKPDFKILGPRFGKSMKAVAAAIAGLTKAQVQTLDAAGQLTLSLPEGEINLLKTDVEWFSEDIPGWSVASQGDLTVALDLQLDAALVQEGLARDLINRIQNLRKEMGLDVTDRISIRIEGPEQVQDAIASNLAYICSEVLAVNLELTLIEAFAPVHLLELEDGLTAQVQLQKFNS